jgi:hypothetical protein
MNEQHKWMERLVDAVEKRLFRLVAPATGMSPAEAGMFFEHIRLTRFGQSPAEEAAAAEPLARLKWSMEG